MLSNPAIFPTICLEAALELHVEAGMHRLRAKSFRLTRYLELLLEQEIISTGHARIITPSDVQQRGAQLSLLFDMHCVKSLNKKLLAKGVICDVREPSCLRISPAPIYNNFSDV